MNIKTACQILGIKADQLEQLTVITIIKQSKKVRNQEGNQYSAEDISEAVNILKKYLRNSPTSARKDQDEEEDQNLTGANITQAKLKSIDAKLTAMTPKLKVAKPLSYSRVPVKQRLDLEGCLGADNLGIFNITYDDKIALPEGYSFNDVYIYLVNNTLMEVTILPWPPIPHPKNPTPIDWGEKPKTPPSAPAIVAVPPRDDKSDLDW